MIISIKPGKKGFAQYSTDREDKAYTIIEGDPLRIDKISSEVLSHSMNRKVSHYSYVLSFKEENLTKNELYEYYQRFKELMFANYNPLELEILSVIHWDDKKPHIHCYVINYSMLNNKNLRLYRGYPDFPRVEAIQEKINYEYSLASPFNNINLLSLTNEQKKRDWVHKKGETYYEVFDDFFYEEIENTIKISKNYDEFIEKLSVSAGNIEIQTYDKIDKALFDKAKFLKEKHLVLKEKENTTGGNYRYISKLFDKKWFNDNLDKIKEALEKTSITNIKYSQSRKSKEAYEKIFNETTQKHLEDITERFVGKEFVKNNYFDLVSNELAKILNFNFTFADQRSFDILSSNIERYLQVCRSKYDIEEFLQKFKFDSYVIEEGYVSFSVQGHSIEIYNENLYRYFTGIQELDFSENDDLKEMQESLTKSLTDLSTNRNRALARELLEKLFYIQKIKNKEEFEKLLDLLGLKIERGGVDKRKGSYITLSNETGKFSLYNDVIYSLVNSNSSHEEYIQKRKDTVSEELNKKFTRFYIEGVCSDILQKGNSINTVYDYQLLNSPLKNFSLSGNNKTGFIYKNQERSKFDEIRDYGKTVSVVKSINDKRSGKNCADMFFLKGSDYISVDTKSDEFKQGLVERIKEKKYGIRVIDEKGNLLYAPAQTPNEDVSKQVENIAKEIRTRLQNGIQTSSKSIVEILNEIKSLDINTRQGQNEFRKLMEELSKMDKTILEACCNTLGINIVRAGKDTKLGEYGTFQFRDKKVSVYSKDIHDIVDRLAKESRAKENTQVSIEI